MLLDKVLLALLAISLIGWVGGAITGQIWMFRARRRGELALRAALVPQILWIIRAVYIPLAATAFVSGMVVTWRTGLSFATPWIAFPIGVFIATVVIGSSYSLPEYGRLVRMLGARGADDAEIQRRIEIAAWVNRIELVLVLCSVVGVVVQLG